MCEYGTYVAKKICLHLSLGNYNTLHHFARCHQMLEAGIVHKTKDRGPDNYCCCCTNASLDKGVVTVRNYCNVAVTGGAAAADDYFCLRMRRFGIIIA